jgi:phospholipid N-methyltransferase
MTRKFLKKGTTVASIAPSSRYLVREMLAGIDFGRTRTLVELGAGLGPITAEIVRRAAGTSCRLLIVEYEPDFCKKLRERFAGTPAEIIQGDSAMRPSWSYSRSRAWRMGRWCWPACAWVASAGRVPTTGGCSRPCGGGWTRPASSGN